MNGWRRVLRSGWIGLMLCLPLVAFASPEPVQIIAFIDPPYMQLHDGKAEGIAVDVMKKVFRQTHTAYNIHFMPSKRAYFMAENSPNTCVLAIERSQERESVFEWVSPILITRYGLYALPGNSLKLEVLNDARKQVIGTYLGSGVGEYLESLGYRVDYANRDVLNIDKLDYRRIGLWATDTLSATILMRQRNIDLGPPKLIFYSSLRSMGCNVGMDPNRVARWQASLLDLYHRGEIRQIYEHYRNGDVEIPPVN